MPLREKDYRAAVRILKSMEGKGQFEAKYAQHIDTEFAQIKFERLPLVEGIDRARDLATLAIALGGQMHCHSYPLGSSDEMVVEALVYVTTRGRVLTADGERVEDDEDADDVAARVFG